MQKSVSRRAPDPHTSVWIMVSMLAMIVLPAAIALNTVRTPGELKIEGSNPTPHGYSLSLLLFIVPILVIAFVYLRRAEIKIPRQAFWRTIGILAPIGCATDFFFASRFFVLIIGATLGISAPALNKPVPIEEYIFYLTGFIAVLLIYLWLDEYWLAEVRRTGLPRGIKEYLSLGAAPSSFRCASRRLDRGWHYLQEAILAKPGRPYRNIFYFPGLGWICPFGEFLPDCATLRQLASIKLQPFLRIASEHALGSHARSPLSMVGLSG